MKIAGIILLVLQAVSIFGAIINGSLSEMISNGEIFELLGFFLIGIIGAILLVIGIKKGKKKDKSDK